MARRPGEDDRFALSPRARRIGGWVAALLLIGGIALAVRILGGNGDGVAVTPGPSGSASGGEPTTIRFGTALDPASGEVAADAEVSRFTDGDPFAYSVRPTDAPPPAVHVEVVRVGGGASETVQSPTAQNLPAGASVIAFSVAATDLIAAFGPGEYVMRIYGDPAAEPIAEGRFELVSAPVPSDAG